MTPSKDHYSTLGVNKTATAEQIRKAYRKLARKFHPDVNKEDDATTKFAEVQEAYDTLSDAEKRKSYDQFGSTGPSAGGFRGDPQWSQASQQGGYGSSVNFADIFGDAFGGGGGGSPFGGGAPTATKGQNQNVSITVTFMTALKGGSEEVPAGESTEKIKIPAGIESGKKLRLKGKGYPGMNGGSAGDVLVTVNVGSHPTYRRDGLDVEVDVPLNIAEASLGTKISLPLPLGGTVDLSVPKGISSGARLRVKGKGCKVSEKKCGDFYAVINIVAPTDMDKETTSLVEKLNKKLTNPRTEGK